VAAPLLILTALRYEAAALAKHLRPDPRDVRLIVIGPRAQNLPKITGPTECRGILLAGLAGALDPSLSDGDVILDEGSPIDVSNIPHCRRGRIATSDRIIATPAEKAALFAATGAAVVDMETDAVRAFASQLGVPFLAIRAVSDLADQTLDPATVSWVTPTGGLRWGKVLGTLCRRPTTIVEMTRLGRRSDRAMQNLATVVREILERRAFPSQGG
jgi:hypothetical protein